VLELTSDLPSDAEIARWLAGAFTLCVFVAALTAVASEPIKAVLLPASIFLTNRMGFPVLSKRHQAVVQKLFEVRCSAVVVVMRAETVVVQG
jgi:protein arginine N-methyltransferase 5